MSEFNVLTSTATDIERLLSDGSVTSQAVLGEYLHQIERYNGYLHAIISVAPKELLMERARVLDEERSQGKLRGPIHGVPIVIKDNTATHPDLDMETTAGTFALAGSRVRDGATFVNQLHEAGAIVFAKANLSEMTNFRGLHMPCGWSAVGGLTESPYVRGGKRWDDGFGGHSSTGGSSSGSAVAVAAGFAPVAVGTDTNGSLLMPATRHDVYSLKPTLESIPQDGICPISYDFDSAGPIAKSARDIAILMDAMIDTSKAKNIPEGGYTKALTKSWNGIKIGVLEPKEWKMPPHVMFPIEEAEKQEEKEILEAYKKLKSLGVEVKEDHNCIIRRTCGRWQKPDRRVMDSQFQKDFESYLSKLEESKVRTLEEVIAFMKDNADLEMPKESLNIKRLENALAYKISAEEYKEALADMRDCGRRRAIDKCLKEFDVNVILGPGDSRINELSSTAGYPIATLPLSYLDLNGRPFGVAAVSTAHSEALLIQLMSAWEVAFPERRLPTEFGEKALRSEL